MCVIYNMYNFVYSDQISVISSSTPSNIKPFLCIESFCIFLVIISLSYTVVTNSYSVLS